MAREVNDWAKAEDDRYVLARSERLLATFYDRIGDLGAALEHAVRAVELLEDDAHPRVRAEHLMELAVAYSRRPRDRSTRPASATGRSWRIAEELGDGDLQAAHAEQPGLRRGAGRRR